MVSCDSNANNVVRKITDKNIIELLVFGESVNLNNKQTDIEKGLWVRLYKVPNTEPNECFAESHGICSYKYYLATSQLDDSPIINAYYLGLFGEIIEYTWQDIKLIDTAKINIIVNKYSEKALKYNKTLKNKITVYEITVMPEGVSIIKVK